MWKYAKACMDSKHTNFRRAVNSNMKRRNKDNDFAAL